MVKLNIIATIIGSLFEIYIGHIFFSKFGEKKFQPKTYYLCLSAISVILILSSLTLIESGFIFIVFSLYSFIHSSLFEIKPLKKTILSFALIITVSLSEMIIVMGITLGIDITIDALQNNTIMYFISILMAKFLAFAILKPIKKTLFFNKKKLPLWFNLSTAILPFTSTFILILLYRFSFIVDDPIYKICTLIADIILITSNFLILFVIDKQEEFFRTEERLLFAETHLKNQISHYKELYAQQETLKKFQHDSKNFYTSLISMVESLPPEDAITYINDKIEINKHSEKVISSGHPVLDAIIYSKTNLAQKKNITISSIIKATSPIYIDELELGVLIGNAIDNAIEACEKITKPIQKKISISIILCGEMLSLEISNPIAVPINVNKLKTDKKDKLLHGYGLESIRTITHKYNGNISFTCQENLFTLSAILVNSK